MQTRIVTAISGAAASQAESTLALSILARVAQLTRGTHHVLGWLGRDPHGGRIYLARNLAGELVGLRAVGGGGAAAGAEDELRVEVVPTFDAASLTLDMACEQCGEACTEWEPFCAECGAVRNVDITAELAGASRPELLRAAQDAAAGQFEVIGEVPRSDGGRTLYFARELASGRLAVLRLRPADGRSGEGYRFAETRVFGGRLTSPYSGELGPPSQPAPTNSHAEPREGDAADPLIEQVVGGRYVVLRKIGEGGMGRVYAARHITMQRDDAIKLMRADAAHDEAALRRFQREALNAARVRHQNVATIYDCGDTGTGGLYIAMELIDGPTLTSVLTRDAPFPVARAVNIARQIADALAAAHRLAPPVTHRDLKPDNVMLTRVDDASEIVKVVDFGIAKAVDDDDHRQQVTAAGLRIGTPAYMSPEQIAGGAIDGRSDVYSLGCILYEMLTGERAFQAKSDVGLFHEKLHGEIPRPRTRRRDVPADVDAVVAKALARVPGERFASAAELRDALSRIAPPVGAAAPVEPRRPRRLAAALLITAVVVVAGAGAALVWPARDSGVTRVSRTVLTSDSAAARVGPVISSGVTARATLGPPAAAVESLPGEPSGSGSKPPAAAVEPPPGQPSGSVSNPPVDSAKVETPNVDSAPPKAAPIVAVARATSAELDSLRQQIQDAKRWWEEDANAELALSGLRDLGNQLEALATKYPRDRRIVDLRAEVEKSITEVRTACLVEAADSTQCQ